MNIQERSQLKAVVKQVEKISDLPTELNQALKRLDQALEAFDQRIKTIEKQHQAVLENVQHLKDIVTEKKELPNARVYKQHKAASGQ